MLGSSGTRIRILCVLMHGIYRRLEMERGKSPLKEKINRMGKNPVRVFFFISQVCKVLILFNLNLNGRRQRL